MFLTRLSSTAWQYKSALGSQQLFYRQTCWPLPRLADGHDRRAYYCHRGTMAKACGRGHLETLGNESKVVMRCLSYRRYGQANYLDKSIRGPLGACFVYMYNTCFTVRYRVKAASFSVCLVYITLQTSWTDPFPGKTEHWVKIQSYFMILPLPPSDSHNSVLYCECR